MPLTQKIHPAARQDLVEIGFYLAQNSEFAADHFFDAITETVWMLLEAPELGEIFRPDASGKTRFRTVTGFPNYVIFYQAGDMLLEIIRVLHGSRDYTESFGK